MELQTTDSDDGSWATENVTFQTLPSADQPQATAPEDGLTPKCGLLTRTVIESPVVQWILPVRLRSATHNDVAFIGDRFVQIRELGDDGQLHDVARKEGFGSRVRNAKVLGSFYEDSFTDGAFEKGGGGDAVRIPSMEPVPGVAPLPQSGSSWLPPQLLVLVLESGHLIFLFLQKTPRDTHEFVVSNVDPPRKEGLVHPGFHMAIDPSSRYITTATCEGLLTIHELRPFDALNRQFRTIGTLNPVAAVRSRSLDGVIHKAEFLFPGATNQETVILVLIVIKRGISKLLTLQWDHGDSLEVALRQDVSSLRLPPEHKMPLLLIPLTVKTSFLSVSENSIAVFRDVIHGSPNPELVNTTKRGQTQYHHGLGKPLWTTWTRPFRRKAYYESKDNIYLAREDGIVFFFEINSDEILESSLDVGDFETNISTAFATVADTFSDILILGGSCGNGSLWVVRAREPSVKIGVIPNWSPVLDFVTTDQFLTWNQTKGLEGAVMKPWNKLTASDYVEHDRIFATAGRGISGNITEFVSGIKANITLDVEYGCALRNVWVFPMPPGEGVAGFTVLLGLHNQSGVIELSPDLTDLREPGLSDTGIDTSARTLAASQLPNGTICQVTETALVLAGPSQSTRHLIADLAGDSNARAENAFVGNSLAVFTSLALQSTPGYTIHVVETTNPDRVSHRFVVEQEVTCLCHCTIGNMKFLAVAVWQLEITTLNFYNMDTLDTKPSFVFSLSRSETSGEACYHNSPLEAVTTLVVVYESAEKTVIVGGTRGGYFLQLEMEFVKVIRVTEFRFEKLGTLPLDVLPTNTSSTTYQHSIFLCCDSAIVLLEDYDIGSTKGFTKRNRIVPVDPGSEQNECFLISSIANIPWKPTENNSVLVITGSRLLIAHLEPSPGTISRRIHLGGTPSRLMYSHVLRCLVVAVTFDDRPTLIFMDPNTGEDLSRPTDRNREDPLEFIPGLGHRGDRIHSLCEWLYEKDEKTFSFILVTTNAGRLLVISAARTDNVVKFFTRYKKSIAETPIYSVCAHADSIFFCAGSTIHWDKLDVVERKIKNHATVGLTSAATTLTVAERKLYALTQTHSLEIIDLDTVEQRKDSFTVGEGLMEQRTRPATHMLAVGDAANSSSSWPLILLSDRECRVAGALVPKGGDGREFTVVLEAELPASVRRFRRGHTRPPWWRSKTAPPRYGRIPSTIDDAEVLGVCLDGSLQHFTLLSMQAWRFLRLVQDAATPQGRWNMEQGFNASEARFFEPSSSPKTRLHVEGDILQHILINKCLDQLFTDAKSFRLFKHYLDELDEGTPPTGVEELSPSISVMTTDGNFESENSYEDGRIKYLELGYQVLGHYLSPVL